MLRQLIRFGIAALAVTALALPVTAAAQGDQQKLVDKAQATLDNFLRDPEMSWLQKNLHRAKAVLIAPEVVKAEFIICCSG